MPAFIYALIAAALFMGGFGIGWKAQDNRAQVTISSMKAKASKELAEAKQAELQAVQKARTEEQANATKLQGALDEAAKREIALRRSLDASRVAERGLRDSIYSIRHDLPGYSPSAAIATADTAADLLGQCAAEVVRLGEAADRHADDALMLRDAWPKASPSKIH